jgi:hypothetical protein
MFQVTNEHFSLFKFPGVIVDIFRKEGMLALWKGHSASLLRVVPYAGIQFMTYDYIKRQFLAKVDSEGHHHPLKVTEAMLCGGTAGAVSTSVTYPLDLARSRLAVTPPSQDAAPRFRVMRSLHSWHQFGGVSELYKGLAPTLLGVIPYGAIAFSANEAVKARISKHLHPFQNKDDIELKVWHKLLSGALAGVVAQTLTYPLEIVRRRMQTAGHVNINSPIESTYTTVLSPYSPGNGGVLRSRKPAALSMVDTFSHLYTSHGWRVFFKGVSLNWLKGPLTVSISFTTFDFLKNMFEKYIP